MDAQLIATVLGILLVAVQTIKTIVEHDKRISALETELKDCIDRCPPSEDYRRNSRQPIAGSHKRTVRRSSYWL